MPQSSFVNFHLDDTVTFSHDLAVPESLQGRSFQVKKISSLILNDFYFNRETLTCYELVDSQNNTLLLTPFRFEDDDQNKIRLSQCLTLQQANALFSNNDAQTHFAISNNLDDQQTISFDPTTLPESIQNWLGRSYYLDLKDNKITTATYVDYDPKGKKNLNPELLLAHHQHDTYTLFQGDYGLYFIEVNFSCERAMNVTLLLDDTAILFPV